MYYDWQDVRGYDSVISRQYTEYTLRAGLTPESLTYNRIAPVYDTRVLGNDLLNLLNVRFVVTDTVASIPVVYKGILPDLFKEGRGCVAQGKIGTDGVFRAEQVLAKHDENYMPPEAGAAIDKAKHAQEAAKTVIEN